MSTSTWVLIVGGILIAISIALSSRSPRVLGFYKLEQVADKYCNVLWKPDEPVNMKILYWSDSLFLVSVKMVIGTSDGEPFYIVADKGGADRSYRISKIRKVVDPDTKEIFSTSGSQSVALFREIIRKS